MNIVDIIAKKRDNRALTRLEIKYFIKSLVSHKIEDYHASTLLMAIYLNGMSHDEIVNLTKEMMKSGEIIDLSDIPGVKVDKHSTGGVGDKTSMVLAPLVASFGVKVAKVSGRGLGHTGGTLDKLESIPGMSINLTNAKFKELVRRNGIAIMGQTKELDPADKTLYALRDVTATVGSLPLITSSIMSKKLASGSDTILLDVKVGSGAFMKTLKDARELSNLLVSVGKACNKDTRAIITDMQEPLGYAVGNILEVKEAIDTLNNKGPKDFTELCLTCAAIMLTQAKVTDNLDKAKEMAEANLKNGKAFYKFKQWIASQGGDTYYLDHPDKFKKAKYVYDIKCKHVGYIKEIEALTIGEAAMHLGAGRLTIKDKIDPTAGIVLNKKVGDHVKFNDLLCKVYTNKENVNDILKTINKAFKILPVKVKTPKVIIDYIK
ncbi:MAG: pyrimidine-nucleoside phosphorylase [Bacilli bacterium]|nr:pyrimidine-nucleoside phosphorylase [Bacilli bacterium]